MVECWATPSDDPCDDIQYLLIYQGCPNATGVNVIQNYLPTYGVFFFPSFVWVYDEEYPIYIHCKVKICDSYENNCSLSCEDELDDVPGDGKRKRNFRSLNQDADDAYSYGPIHVVHTDKLHCSQNSGGCSDICLDVNDDVIMCSCPEGKTLINDEKTCREIQKINEGWMLSSQEMAMMVALLLAFAFLLIIGGIMMRKMHLLLEANVPSQKA